MPERRRRNISSIISVEDRLYLLEEKLKIAESRISILERELSRTRDHTFLPPPHPHPRYDDEFTLPPIFTDPPNVTIIGDNNNEFDSWAKEVKVDKSKWIRISGDES